MNCSTCNSPMFIVLCDRAFCEKCYETLQHQQRQLIEKFPNGAVIDQITPGWWKDNCFALAVKKHGCSEDEKP